MRRFRSRKVRREVRVEERFPIPVHGQILRTGRDLYYALMGSGQAGWLADRRMLSIGEIKPYPLRVIKDPTNPLDNDMLRTEEVMPEPCGDNI